MMGVLLANVAPQATRTEVETVLYGLVALGGMALIYIKIFVRKPPLEAQFVSQTEFREFKNDVKEEFHAINTNAGKIIEKIEESKTEMLNAGERRAAKIHERINELDRAVAAVNERTRKM